MSSFENFCTEEAKRQTNKGFKVPTISDAYAYLQWRREARRRWESASGEEHEDTFTMEIENDAEAVVASVVKCASSRDSRSVPSTFKIEKETESIVSSLELLLRLSVFDRSDLTLLGVINEFRNSAADLLGKGLLGCAKGKYPEVYILYELFALRKLFLHWDKLGSTDQMAALKTALSLVTLVKSPAYTKLEIQLKSAEEDPLSVTGKTVNLVTYLDQACRDTPYAFPSICHNIISSIYPHYKGPTGKLSPSFELNETTNSDDNITSEEEEECTEEVIKVNNLQNKRIKREEVSESQQTSNYSQRPSGVVGRDKEICHSKYHARYSAEDKHASKGCRFCVVCHMMETLFNAYKYECCWGHGPTERRISVHLKKYPSIRDTALKRLQDMQNGIVLQPYDIPLI